MEDAPSVPNLFADSARASDDAGSPARPDSGPRPRRDRRSDDEAHPRTPPGPDPARHAAARRDLFRGRGPRSSCKDSPTPTGHITVHSWRGQIVITDSPPPIGMIDVSADRVIIWRKVDPKRAPGPTAS